MALKKKERAVNFGKHRARIGQGERVVLERLANLEQLNLSETVRFCIRREAERRGLWPPKQQGQLQPATPLKPEVQHERTQQSS